MIGIFFDDLEAALCSQLAQIEDLRFRVLVKRRNADIQRRALQNSSPMPASVPSSSTIWR